MEAYSCTDETFDNNLKTEYRLSIQVGLDGFSFCIQDETTKKFLAFRHEPFLLSNYSFLVRKLNEIFETEERLQGQFKHVTIVVNTQNFTFAPASQESVNGSIVLKLNTGYDDGDSIYSFDAEPYGLKVIFAVPASLYSFFCNQYSNPVFTHFTKSLLSLFSLKQGKEKHSALIVDQSRYFTLFVSDGADIIFANSFQYRSDPDFNFFLTASLQNLALNTKDIEVYIAGDMAYESERYEYLKNKCKAAEFLKLSNKYQYSYTFSQLPQHRFLSVINAEV